MIDQLIRQAEKDSGAWDCLECACFPCECEEPISEHDREYEWSAGK